MIRYVYIIKSRNENIYFIGRTYFPLSQLSDINQIKEGYFAKNRPWDLLHLEFFLEEEKALERANFLKNQKDDFLEKLILSKFNKLQAYYEMPS